MAGDITTLAFVQVRLPLLDYRGTDANDQKHAQDRTTSVIRKWSILRGELQTARSQTMSCLEASESKGAVVLKIADRPRFDGLQATISAHIDQIAALEDAARKLDATGANLWVSDVINQTHSAGLSEDRMKKRKSQLVAEHTLRNPGMPIEDVLKLPEYLKTMPMLEREIASSKAYREKWKPILHEMKAILESVGC